MRKIIYSHWITGNIVFMTIFHIMYFGSKLMNPTQPDLPYSTFLKVITFLSLFYTTIFTALDYLLIFKNRYKDFNKKEQMK